jgi:heme/copper-type cytochrome/quinol oxidase subunit 3
VTRFQTGKLAVAVFIASEAVFFAFLIAAYIFYSGATVRGPTAANSLNPGRTLVFTICLIASSGALWMAERRLEGGHATAFRVWLALTILLGFVFILGQAMEYAGLISKSVTPARNLFGATFFTLTGFHGFHVVCGLVALLGMLALALLRDFGPKEISGLGALALYWHFVDTVWIVIFSLVYLAVWL